MRLKWKRLLCCLACCLLLVPGGAIGQEAPVGAVDTPAQAATSETVGEAAPVTITAVGSADVSIAPDIAMLTMGVNATADTVTGAQAKAAEKLDALKTALATFGIEKVYTLSYHVESVYSYQYGKLGDTENLSGYKAASQVAVYLTDAGRVGEVIDAALQSGADNSYELSFQSSEKQDAYNQAMTRAAQYAMRKAQLLAEAAGLTLNRLESIRELGEKVETFGAAEVTEDQPEGAHGMLRVNAMVEVTYSVK